MAVRALIVDDEALAVAGLRRLCDRSGRVEIVGVAADGASGLELIAASRPDAIFLDVAMPMMSGLDVAAQLARLPDPPRIVFVTAHDHFASQAFDLAITDYVLKPVDPARFDRALDRLEASLARGAARASSRADLWVPYLGGMTRVRTDDVLRLEAEGDYVRIHTAERSYLMRTTLGELLERLGAGFVRIHRSTAMPVGRITALRHLGNGAWAAVDPDDRAASIGRVYLSGVRQRLGIEEGDESRA